MSQRTITVGADRIKIKTARKTSRGNMCGWNVDISDSAGNKKRYFRCVLEEQVAIDLSYVEFVKEFKATEQEMDEDQAIRFDLGIKGV